MVASVAFSILERVLIYIVARLSICCYCDRWRLNLGVVNPNLTHHYCRARIVSVVAKSRPTSLQYVNSLFRHITKYNFNKVLLLVTKLFLSKVTIYLQRYFRLLRKIVSLHYFHV